MYSSCTFCFAELGSNELVEAFPVGRRLAFDASRGRLWVVCAKCGRWNLTPLEERWEAIEAAERSFRRTQIRAATDNISLARANDGTELIRVGSAGRPELSAWRYGDMFVKRWKRSAAAGAVVIAGIGVVVATGSLMTLTAVLPGGTLLLQVPTWLHAAYERRRIVARLPQSDGGTALIRGRHVRSARLVSRPDESWVLQVKHSRGEDRLDGMDALQVAAPVLARVNAEGARKRTVSDALSMLDENGDASSLVSKIASRNRIHPMGGWPRTQELAGYPKADRLALEMIATGEVERRALEGELKYLERAWREADELAAIADNLLMPDSVRLRADEMKAQDRR